MKKNRLIQLTILLLVFFANAQPVVSYGSYNFYGTFTAVDSSNFYPGDPGENVVWNFQSLITNNTISGSYLTVPVNTAPGHEQFPEANFCTKELTTGVSSPIENYTFLRITSSISEYFGRTNSQGVVIDRLIDTREFALPLNYGDEYFGTFQRTTDSVPISYAITYDSYGTMILPYGTFSNVIRTKSVDSRYTQYSWEQYSPYYRPFLAITYVNSTSQAYLTMYEITGGLSTVENIVENNIVIYPNPAKDFLNIQLPENSYVDRLLIKDLSGKNILESTQDTRQIDVENLVSGIYLLEVYSNNKKYLNKFIKR